MAESKNRSPRFLWAALLAIFVFGAGLTSPIWFLLADMGPVEAMHAGMPFVEAAIVGIVLVTIIGILVHRVIPVEVPDDEALPPDNDVWKHRIVHLLTILMFVVPFLTIILGLLLKRVVESGAD